MWAPEGSWCAYRLMFAISADISSAVVTMRTLASIQNGRPPPAT